MELVATFNAFLKDTVNLDATRLSSLETSAEALETYLLGSGWGPSIIGFERQGSWAHDTIIKPVDQGEFDADLLVRVEPVEGWEAKDYLNELKRAFKKSLTYKRKVKVWDYCVTITYANDKRVDIAPLVVGRAWPGSLEVCNRSENEFVASQPTLFTGWLVERNAISAGNSFRKVTRLVKYLRDIKTRFVCPSVLLTTLLANQIYETDRDADTLKNVPCTLQTLMGRLDDWLQANTTKPVVSNPFLTSEDFAASWTEKQYESFRNRIHGYRGWIDDAIGATDRASSIAGWRKLFGEDFAPGEVTKADVQEGRFALAQPVAKAVGAVGDLIDSLKVYGMRGLPKNYARMAHMDRPSWTEAMDDEVEVIVSATVGGGDRHMNSRPVASGDLLSAGPSIHFYATQPDGSSLGADYSVQWRVTNAPGSPQIRGGFYPGDSTFHRVETLSYRGIHVVEAFVIRQSDRRLVGWSDPFYVAID